MLIENDCLGHKLTGFFKGIVVKHCLSQDGSKSGNGVCKVWIPGVYSEELKENPDSLPDAEQISPLFGGSWNGNGIFSYPNLGSIVVCGFYNEDQNFPFFFGSVLGGSAAESMYASAKPNVTEDNIKSGQDAFKHIISVDKSKIEMNEGGYIDIVANADRDGENHVHIVMDGKGNLIIDTTQQIYLHAPQINITADQTFELTSPQVKINATQSFELNTQSSKESVSGKKDVTAQDITLIGGSSANVVSPTIFLDASTGACKIQGKTHAPAFFD